METIIYITFQVLGKRQGREMAALFFAIIHFFIGGQKKAATGLLSICSVYSNVAIAYRIVDQVNTVFHLELLQKI